MRAVGPGLSQFGVTSVLTRPTMSVYAQSTGGQPQLIRTNTGWTTEGYTYDLAVAAQTVAAFPLSANSADCAVVVTVEPGNYTIQVSGVGATTGEALVEIYILP